MKIDIMLTIRLTPENKKEALEDFGPLYHEFRRQVDEDVKAGRPLQVPADSQIRWLLNTPRFE